MRKTKRDYAQDKLCRELGDEYRILYIDWERCIYRDFGNKFDVEVSGTHTTSNHKTATIYLWYDARFTIACIRDVAFSEIGNIVDKLYDYTCKLYDAGAVTEESLRKLGHIHDCV